MLPDKIDTEILRSALQKLQAKPPQSLTVRETSVYRAYQKQQEHDTRQIYYGSVPQKDMIALTGRQAKLLRDFATKWNIPVCEKVSSLFVVLRAIFDRMAKLSPKSDDPLLCGPFTPAKEEYRKWRAALAKVDYEQRVGLVRGIKEINAVWHPFTSALRQSIETMERRNLGGTEAADMIREVLEGGRRSMVSLLGSHGEHTDSDIGNDSDGESTAVST